MIRVGLVDLDTAHPAFLLSLLQRTDDIRVTAVYDGGVVQSPSYVAQFARDHGVEHVCASLDELVSVVDAGMVLSQNWDLHLERAQPFLEAGKPVFIDKPIVGRRREIDALVALAARTGAPIIGGSTMRFAEELVALRQRVGELGALVSAFASGPGDWLNYGSHVVEMVAAFFGAGVEAVSYIGGERSQLFLLEQRTGPPVILQLSGGLNYSDNGCVFMLTTERSVEVIHPRGVWQMSDATLGALARFFREGLAPLSLADSLEVVKVCLAAAESRRLGRRVTLDELSPDAGFDGAAYTSEYARRGGYEGDGLSARSRYVVQ